MNQYFEIAELTDQALRSGEYLMADQFLNKMLYESKPEVATEILSEQNMVYKLLTEVLLCERNRGRGEDSFKAFHQSYKEFFQIYQRMKRMIRRIWFGFEREQQEEINGLLSSYPVSSDLLAVVAKYSVPPAWWGDLFEKLSELLQKQHPDIAGEIREYRTWFQREGLLGTERCCPERKKQHAFSCHRLSYHKIPEEDEGSPGGIADEKRLAIIFCTHDEEYARECREYIDYLVLPEGMTGELLEIHGAPGMAAGYNFGMKSTQAKYKLYIHHDTLLISSSIPEKLVKSFKEDEETGLIGVFGSTVLPDSGKWYQAPYEKSVLSLYQDAILNFLMPKKEEKPVLKEAEAVDGAFLATAKDVLWREDLFDDWHFYDIAECFEMRRNGYHVKLYADTEPWILHESTLRKDPEDRYGRYCSVFLKKIKKIENRG